MKHPCKENQCGRCCNPVKVHQGFTNIPTNSKGEKIWIEKNEMWIPENHPETVKLAIFECINYDKDKKECRDYKNRPEICRNSGCIDKDSKDATHDQYKSMTETKFYKIKGKE